MKTYVFKQMRGRIGNGDEKQIVMTTEVSNGGPQARVYFDPMLGAPGRDFVENSRHISGHFGACANGSIMPIHTVWDSTASTPEKFGIESGWAKGLPVVKGLFGCKEETSFHPTHDVSASGSTHETNASGNGGFVDYLERNVMPCFPNLAPEWEFDETGEMDEDGLYPIVAGPVIWTTDLGPGRMVGDVEGLERRQAIGDKGLILYPSCVPNLSGPMQVMDQLYGELQSGMTSNAEAIVAERRAAAGKVTKNNKTLAAAKRKTEVVPPINLTNFDYPRILNGRETDPLKKRPFEYVFSPENVLRGSRMG